jgi:hypothetical protein
MEILDQVKDVVLWSNPTQNVLHRGLLKMCNV